jgi:glycine dehydrogenase subunit 2
MIEPTETESKETLDAFIDAMKKIAEEARTDPELVHAAPHTTELSRLDEVTAAREPNLRWRRVSDAAPQEREPAMAG